MILHWYGKLNDVQPQALTLLNMAIAHLQLKELDKAFTILESIEPKSFGKKIYLYYATVAEYHHLNNESTEASKHLGLALSHVSNGSQKKFLERKRETYELK